MKTLSAQKHGVYLLSFVALLALAGLYPAQLVPNAAGAPAAALDEGPLKVLAGHRSAVLADIAPVGELSGSTNLALTIGLAPRNNPGLQKFLQEMRDPASTNYGRSLTVDQYVERFSPSEADYEAAMDFAKARGLTVTSTYRNRLMFNAKGSAADIEKLFHVRLQLHAHPTENRLFFAPDRDPSVDSRFQVLEVIGLNNFGSPRRLGPKPQSYGTNSSVRYSTAGSGPGGLVGNDFRNTYAPGVTLNGSGQYIALLQFNPYYPQDITYYAKIAGLANINVTNISVNGFDTSPPATNGVNDLEQTGDIEMAMSMAPAATILVYEGDEMVSIFNRMADDGLAKQISCSWGMAYGTAPSQLLINTINTLNAQGQSVFIASGDNGAYAPGGGVSAGAWNTNGYYFNPDSFTNVTICGGTTLKLTAQGGTYQSETTWSGSGGGQSTNFSLPAYQQGISMTANRGSTTLRNVPDVAAVSAGMLITGYGTNAYVIGDGTSYAAPLWAGLMALINEQRADNGLPSFVNLNETLYAIGKGPNYASAFHDITTGNTTNTAQNPTNYFAVQGYDLCTGWGTPKGDNLIRLLSQPTDALRISPGFGFTTTIPYGSAASPVSTTFVLSNASAGTIFWSPSEAPDWLNLSSPGSALLAGATMNVTLALKPSVATNLPVGTYQYKQRFLDSSTGVPHYRLFVLTVSAAPQPLTVIGFNASMVVPTNGTLINPYADSFGINNGSTFYQEGLPGSTRGLPASGRFVSGWDGQTVFQIGPIPGNNTLMLGNSYSTSGTLTLSTPKSLNSLVVLAASTYATASTVGTLRINFTNGTFSSNITFNAHDWFSPVANGAISGFGRIYLPTFTVEDQYGDGNPSFFQTAIPLGALGLTQAIASITFNMPTTATNTGIFAISGQSGALSGLKPAITQQPQSVTNLYATNGVTFAVGASGATPFSYQWLSNGVPLPNGIMPILSFDPIIPASYAAAYTVVVTNLYGSVTSAVATLSFYRSGPVITQQPSGRNLFVDENLSLSLGVSSPIPVSYLWRFNGAPISNATNAIFYLPNVQTNNAGSYTVICSNFYGSTTSAPAVVAISVPIAPFPRAAADLNPLGYWRLNETNGTIAFESINGYNGIYNNVVLGKPGYGSTNGTGTEPKSLAAQFGPNGAQSYVSIPALDLSVPNGGNGKFSIAAWVKATNTVPSGAGIFAKGYGGGDEQFGLACGAGGNKFQFFVRNQAGTASLANSSIAPDNQWHFLVGVCDQVNSSITLYVDGTNVASGAITPGSGIHATSLPASIGARTSVTNGPFDLQFLGLIDDALILTNALTSAQVFALYSAGQYAPVITQQPQSPWIGRVGGSATNQVTVTGTQLSYQWHGPSGPLSGGTNANLILTNLINSQLGNYYVIASNAYGTAQSSNAFLNVVVSNAAYFSASLALNPIGYWRLNETNGTSAHDSAGTNDGHYHNAVLGQPGYNSTATFPTDPFELGTLFGLSPYRDGYVAISNIDLSQPDTGNGQFTIATWIRANSNWRDHAIRYPAIVSKGYGGGEQFCLDFGSFDYALDGALRFFVRDRYNNRWAANSFFYPGDNNWHLVVGVCDQANSVVSVYVDGTNAASGYLQSGNGIHATSVPVSIGSQQSGPGSAYDVQFFGTMNDTAIFTNALTSAQVFALYSEALPAPAIRKQPQILMSCFPGDSVTNSILVSGKDLSYRWFGPAGAIAGATNATFILTNVQNSNLGNYYVTISNQYTVVQSSNSILAFVPTAPYPLAIMAQDPIAYWRFNETNGNFAIDYAGRSHGVYTNVILGQPGYNSAAAFPPEPGQVSAKFGPTNGARSYVSVSDLDLGFQDLNYDTHEFSIAGWVKVNSSVQNGAGIIAKGPANQEEFVIDCGGVSNAFRFLVRDKNNTPYFASSSVVPDGKWHFLAAVFHSEAGPCYLALYIDGTNVAQVPGPFPNLGLGKSGVDFTAMPIRIGARESTLSLPDWQLNGNINDLAILPRALNSTEILALYYAGNPAFTVMTQPAWKSSLTTAQLNGTANPSTFSSTAWFQYGTSTNYGQTTAAQSLGNGLSNVSFYASISGLTAGALYHARAVISNSVAVIYGNDVVISAVQNPVSFNSSGLGWSVNESGAYSTPAISNNLLRATDGALYQARSVFYHVPQYIGAFKAAFTYQDVGGGGANGVAFVLQNDARGVSALGGIGNGLGYGGITNSLAVELNVYSGDGYSAGYIVLTNGLIGTGSDFHPTGDINLASGNPINITVNYANGQMALKFVDPVANKTFSTNLSIGNLTSTVKGETAYVGFTGASGAVASTQSITNFSFVSIPTAEIEKAGNNVTISWPASVPGYSLQMSTNLASGNWVSVTNQQSVVNGQNQVTLPMSSVNSFYRLVLPLIP
jgi:subtilase family serine protease